MEKKITVVEGNDGNYYYISYLSENVACDDREHHSQVWKQHQT